MQGDSVRALRRESRLEVETCATVRQGRRRRCRSMPTRVLTAPGRNAFALESLTPARVAVRAFCAAATTLCVSYARIAARSRSDLGVNSAARDLV